MRNIDVREVKTALRRMGFYYLLMLINIIPCAGIIPDAFPTRNLSAVYLLLLSVCLVMYYAYRISPSGGLSAMMRLISWMALLMLLLRGIKYSAFAEVAFLARHTWYLYYLPMLLLPLFLFNISLLVSAKESSNIGKKWLWIHAVTALLIAAVLTNDLHQQAFIFKPDFIDWDNDYSHGWLFYAVTVWQYALYLASILILLMKCRVIGSKKNAWLLLIPLSSGIVLNVLLLTGRMPKLNGFSLIEFPETHIFTVAVVLECCMQLGLIPTNTEYGKLFREFSIAAQITDKNGSPVYASKAAHPLAQEEFALPDNSRVGEHTLMRKMKLPGGFGFWQDDMTELDRLNSELAETKEELTQEAELRRLQNELKERQTKIEQRTLVYDTVAKRTQRQSHAISFLAKTARQSENVSQRDECRKRITLLGSYIKRYANLTLLSQEHSVIEAGELGLSVSEVLHYLNYCGTPSEFLQRGNGTVPAEAALTVFDAFETLLEANASCLHGVFAVLSAQERITLKLTFENLTESLSEEKVRQLDAFGVRSEEKREDDVTYICFTLPKGGDGV